MNKAQKGFVNPYRPGAGHMPPFLAGRETETEEFGRLLDQQIILDNLVLTGLRGVGKTVLLDTLKPIALARGWRWIGADLSESTSLSETNIAVRLLTDLSVVTSSIAVRGKQRREIGFAGKTVISGQRLDYSFLTALFNDTAGLIADRLKAVLNFVWGVLQNQPPGRIIFAYDEAQNLADHADKEEYPLSLLLDVFQSIQKKDVPFMLVLAGLPTLFPKLVEARTFAERMFRVVFLERLNETESRDAILKPLDRRNSPVTMTSQSVDAIIKLSAGYPYFIQFVCREAYDVVLQQFSKGVKPSVPFEGILAKLDTDFFAGRWGRVTDRQRELLRVISTLDNCDEEFAVQEILVRARKLLAKPFSPSQVSQMLSTLSDAGLVFKNRRGKYSFAVPMMGWFIKRYYAGA